MSHTITMPVRSLQALTDIAPKQDVRYYLCGVCVRPAAGHAIATTGTILLMLELDITPDAPEFIISRAQCLDVLKACKALGKRAFATVTIEYQPQSGAPAYVRITVGDNTYTAPAVDGRFPQLAQLMSPVQPILPGGTLECFHVPQYDPALLCQLSDAMQHADNTKARPYLQPNRDNAAYLYWPGARGTERALGLIMPMCADVASDYLADLLLWGRK